MISDVAYARKALFDRYGKYLHGWMVGLRAARKGDFRVMSNRASEQWSARIVDLPGKDKIIDRIACNQLRYMSIRQAMATALAVSKNLEKP